MTDTLAQWLKRLERGHPKSIDLGLERCARVYQSMGAPRPGPRIFTVAGTNGKGSVVAYICAILGAAGYRHGCFTSPHLFEFNERMQIMGQAVESEKIIAAFKRTEQARHGVSLTYFEFTALAAFDLMQQSQLDVAVLEVGLGGRLDAVNLVDPDCAVITPVGMDHQEYLGTDRESIGTEKAGIMRAGIPLICGDRDPPSSIFTKAETLHSRVAVLGRDFHVSGQNGKQVLNLGTECLGIPGPPMAGRHQVDNLATAVAAVHSLLPGALEDSHRWRQAVQATRLPGRMSPSQFDRRVILDVGHNPMAAEAVATQLSSRPSGAVHCVIGMLKDKDVENVARFLGGVVDHWYCAGLEGERGQSGSDLACRISKAVPEAGIREFDSVAHALAEAGRVAGEDELILVFGSFQTVALAMRWLRPA